jgi:hypothetical protein
MRTLGERRVRLRARARLPRRTVKPAREAGALVRAGEDESRIRPICPRRRPRHDFGLGESRRRRPSARTAKNEAHEGADSELDLRRGDQYWRNTRSRTPDVSTRTIARAMTTGRGSSVRAMEPESAELVESACRLFTSPACASTVGPASAVDGWNGPNSGWRSRLSLACCRRARGWWPVEVDGTSAGGGGSGSLVAGGGGGSGAGSGVGVWARAPAQTSSAMATTPIANLTLTADPGCTILRRDLELLAQRNRLQTTASSKRTAPATLTLPARPSGMQP